MKDNQSTTPPTSAWERKEFESVIAYKAFRAYLDSQERNIESIAKELSKNSNCIRNWAEKYDWESRAAMFDFMKAQKEKQDSLTEVKKMAELQTNLGRMLQVQGAKALKEKDFSDEPIPVILKAIEIGVQIERSARNIDKKSI